jgi:excisionase family DNA binding protein
MEELWDIKRVSQYLGIKRSTLYAMIERKEIPHYRIGRLARFRPVEIDAWLLTKKQETEKPVRMAKPASSPLSPAAQIVRAAIDEVNPGRYNRSGKSDRIKGLGKEG